MRDDMKIWHALAVFVVVILITIVMTYNPGPKPNNGFQWSVSRDDDPYTKVTRNTSANSIIINHRKDVYVILKKANTFVMVRGDSIIIEDF